MTWTRRLLLVYLQVRIYLYRKRVLLLTLLVCVVYAMYLPALLYLLRVTYLKLLDKVHEIYVALLMIS